MDHGPSTDWGEDKAAEYKTRLGLWMFLVYFIAYAGFVVINSVWPQLMTKTVGGLNLAIVYGMGLIIFALVLAFIYNTLSCKAENGCDDGIVDEEEEDS